MGKKKRKKGKEGKWRKIKEKTRKDDNRSSGTTGDLGPNPSPRRDPLTPWICVSPPAE